MNNFLRALIQRPLNKLGYQISKFSNSISSPPVEFTEADARIMKFVIDHELSMVSEERLIATIQACKYAIENNIPGDFVECGVWRGGNAIAAKMVFEAYGCDKKVYLFDTFAGMTVPTVFDTSPINSMPTMEEFDQKQSGDHNEWCFASLEDVRENFKKSKVELSGVKFVQGDVSETLLIKENLPESISVLRLDTDWYESTKSEMEVLYPILSDRGALIIDDFGYWDGARKAIEEYFQESAYSRPLLQYIDQTGRMGVK